MLLVEGDEILVTLAECCMRVCQGLLSCSYFWQLDVDGDVRRCMQGAVTTFSGDSLVSAELPCGPVADLGLMTRRGCAQVCQAVLCSRWYLTLLVFRAPNHREICSLKTARGMNYATAMTGLEPA